MSTPPPVRVRLRHADLDTFVERFAVNVTRGGIFLASRSPRPVGEVFAFEVQLADGKVALAGQGKVTWVKDYNPAEPQKPYGMGVQFVRLEPESRETLNRMLKLKASGKQAGTGRGASQPMAPLGARGPAHTPANGVATPGLRVDTSVDLASEYGLDESAIRRAVDRNWVGSSGVRAVDSELEELLKPDSSEPPTLAEALAELPRLLDPTARRRTGAFRAAEAADKPVSGENGTAVPKRDDHGKS